MVLKENQRDNRHFGGFNLKNRHPHFFHLLKPPGKMKVGPVVLDSLQDQKGKIKASFSANGRLGVGETVSLADPAKKQKKRNWGAGRALRHQFCLSQSEAIGDRKGSTSFGWLVFLELVPPPLFVRRLEGKPT